MGFLENMRIFLVAGGLIVLAGQVASETALDDVDEQFAIASQHFGEGQVQVHTRRDQEGASTHSVLTINCKEQTYRRDYEADTPPEVFPLGDYENPADKMTSADAVATAAVHTCAEHGHPLLEWRW
ncbi:MAG: hypothetical protein AAF636_17740 [Pseudomonadota bacterium]